LDVAPCPARFGTFQTGSSEFVIFLGLVPRLLGVKFILFRLLLRPTACMTATWCVCMAQGIIPLRVSVVALAPRVMAHAPVRAGGRSCEAETCCSRRRLVVGIPLVGNWSEMLPTGQRVDVLPVWVLTRALSPPHIESWPSHCQRCWVTLCLTQIFSPSKGGLIRALVSSP
jgi:hypothetical protein